MFTSQKIIESRMAGVIDDEECDVALDIAMRVEKQITCVLSGKVMDSRTAKALYLGPQCAAVLHPDAAENQVVVDLMAEEGLTMKDAVATWEKIDA